MPSPIRWALLPLWLGGCAVSDEQVPSDLTAVEVDCDSVTPDATVRLAGLKFVPSDVSVPDGGVIYWINEDTVKHTVTSGNPFTETSGQLFDSGRLEVGDPYCLQFGGEGTVDYYCKIHPVLMQGGTITVTPDDG